MVKRPEEKEDNMIKEPDTAVLSHDLKKNNMGTVKPEPVKSRMTSLKNVRPEKKKESLTSEIPRTVSILSELETYAYTNATGSFASLAESADWTAESASAIRGAVDLALMLNLNRLAVRLARKGAALFPDDPNLRKAVRVLREPRILGTAPASDRKLDASRKWLCRHANQYRGKWAAVRAGDLTGVANSARELRDATDSLFHSEDTLITRVFKNKKDCG